MSDLSAMVTELNSHYGLLSLKAGTEWEDMDYAEIDHLYSLGRKKLPILVKIAGSEAKTDLRHLREIGVNSLLAPMIESEYALEKFVTITKEVYEGSGINPLLSINIETIQGYRQLDNILKNPYFEDINTVVIGRLDLCLSMHIDDVDHPEVVQITKDIASRVGGWRQCLPVM
jgi:4-hydroxy-2-oxoheptanedioate aldolase